MKLYVNEKLYSIHNKFYVKDENNVDIYEISSKVLSFGDKTTITDMHGNIIAYIEQKLFHIMPHYDIYIDGNLVCKINKKFSWFENDYLLSNGYIVDGNFWGLDFVIYDNNNKEIGNIKKEFISIGDKYEINVLDINNIKIILAIIVVIANDINRIQKNN